MNYTDIPSPNRRRAGWRATGAAVALLLTGSVIGWSASGDFGPTASAAPAHAATPAAAAPAPLATASYAGVVDQVTPAVVTVRSERRVRNISQDIPEGLREFFGDQFGQGRRGRQMPERREGGLGSGVIVRPDGYILTNNHVVDGAEQVNVELTDGRTFKAKVVGTDQPSDLAVLKVDGTNLQTLALGDSDAVRVGDVVLAVGNPLGVGQTVTMGIVSAKGRATAAGGDATYEDFIQTDAPINQGNSGGALVSTGGQLIGINSQILTPSGGNIGIGFAIPANMAKNVMTQLIEHGEVHRSQIGVTIQPVTSDIANSLGLSQVRGALVNSVQAGSPADKAGVRRGDVITGVNGQAIKNGNELRNDVSQLPPGTTAKLTIVRDGKEQNVNVTLAERKAAAAESGEPDSAGNPTGFGMAVEPVTRDRARELGLASTSGVVIVDMQSGGRAADAGLRPGDVIVEVDRKPVNDAEGLRAALKNGSRPALLLVHRGDTTFFATLERQ
jgi:Do/DeqQ family serine protease